jgi:hypothetical protein
MKSKIFQKSQKKNWPKKPKLAKIFKKKPKKDKFAKKKPKLAQIRLFWKFLAFLEKKIW